MKHRFSLLACLTALTMASATMAADPAPTSGNESFTLYEFAGSSKALGQLDEQLQKDPRFKELGCENIKVGKAKQSPKYLCKQNNGRAYELFMSGVKSGVKLNSTAGVCPIGCIITRCPPPSGPYRCCNFTTWQPC